MSMMSSLIVLASKLLGPHESYKLYVYDDATGLPVVSETCR
jgi:hypothetical protein